MIVLLGFYKRKAGLSLEQFQRHWREIHGPLLAQNPACLEHIRRYVQHQCVPGVPGVNPLDYDGFSETWFESLEARKQMRDDPRYRIVAEDTPKFLDQAKTVQMLDHQVVQIGHDHAGEWMSTKAAM